MAIASDKVAESFFNIVANTAIPVGLMPLFAEDELLVIYGEASLEAILNVDYTIALSPPNYDQFTITPLPSLLTKINNLIAADLLSVEINYITVRRKMDYLTSVTPELARSVVFLSRELERTAMRFMQLQEAVSRSVSLARKEVGNNEEPFIITPEAFKFLGWNEDGTALTNYSALDIGVTPVSSFMDDVLLASTASNARALLGVTPLFYNVKDYGALGNGTTNDAAAINAAVAAATAGGGGIVYFPEGNYKINSPIAVNTSVGIRLLGEHPIATAITVGANVAGITLAGTGRHTVENMQILGHGVASGTTGVSTSSTSHCIHIASDGVDTYLHRLLIAGGYYGVRNDGTDTSMNNVIIYNTYGSALIYNTGGAPWLHRCKIDNPWPVAIPAAGVSTAARANSTAYSVGDVRSSGGYYLQCVTAGTSGVGSPTLQNYGVNITDGTVVWLLACKTDLSALELTTGSSEVHITQSDFSGAQFRGIFINNNLAGVAPWVIEMQGSCVSGSVGATIDCVAGTTLMLSGNEIFTPISVEAGLAFRSTWTGDATVVNNVMPGAAGRTGILLQGGTNIAISANTICGWGWGIIVDVAVSKFLINGNILGSSTRWGANNAAVLIAVGASNYYNVVNNIIRGFVATGITDGGTGVNKTLTGNV